MAGYCFPEPGLLLCEEVSADLVVVIQRQELAALGLQRRNIRRWGEPAAGPCSPLRGLRPPRVELFPNRRTQSVIGAKHTQPQNHCTFQQVSRTPGHRTARATMPAPEDWLAVLPILDGSH